MGDGGGTGKASAAVAYVGLWSAQILAAKAFVSRPHSLHSVVSACLAAELLKLAACAAALRAGPAALAARAWADARAGEQGATLVAVALCYTVYNLLSFINLSVVPASVYKAVLSVRLAFAVGLDAARTGRCPAHRLAGALSCACAAAVVSPFHAEGSAAFVAVCAQAFLSALAGALTQRILQRYPPGAAAAAHAQAPAAAAPPAPPAPASAVRRYLVDLAERNSSLYVATSAALGGCLALLAAFAAAFGRGAAPAADPRSGSRVWALALSVALSAAAGLSTSHLLTVAGNVAKAMLAGAEVCAVTLASAVLFGEPLTWRIAAGAAFTLAGFALHERVLPLPPALLRRLPPTLRPDDDAASGAKHGDDDDDADCTGAVNRAWLAAAVVAAPALLALAAWRGLWLAPPAARMARYVEAMDAPVAQCAAVPALWAPHSRGQMPKRYKQLHPGACPPDLHFYALAPAEHGGTLLHMNCSGGEARYTPNFLDDEAPGNVAAVARATVFAPGGAAVTLSHKVWHLELACSRPGAGRRPPVTAREVALLSGPLARRLQMAGDAAKAAALADAEPVAMPRRPHVIVLLMDALSKDTAEAVLPDLLSLLRRPGAFGPRVNAVEFSRLNVVGASGAADWAAMLCGGNCSGGLGAPLPLLDAARGGGYGTMLLSNACPAGLAPFAPGGAGAEVTLPERYACLHPGDARDCRLRDSATHSWLRAAADAVAATRAVPAPPVFAVVAAHEAHPATPPPRDLDRLSRLQPPLLQALAALNASGVLEDSLLLLVGGGGAPGGLRPEAYAPAQQAARRPLLWMLLGSRAGAALFGAADDAAVARGVALARANAGRLVTMHDLYRTIADAAGLVGAGADGAGEVGGRRVAPRPGALNPLTQQLPEGRTCRAAGVPPGLCACLQRKRLLG